ncbi:MAG: DUF222 domain-containing protein [Pseudomonadales bacterium]|nr:DUF222 domain-containing protein [Pseudomonadales bacterium]MCP5204333.1 DUF222 domain-containing protein [Pseudomonadales bacterium]
MNPVPAPQQPARDLAVLEDEITELAAHLSAATYCLLTPIAEFDLRSGWSGAGLKSCAHWLNWKCGISLGAAREKVRVAHALPGLPKISATLRGGRISFSKVRAITRVATPQNEDYLLMIAEHGTASHVERLVRNYRKVKRLEALERDNRHHELRELSWHVDDDGSYVLKGRLSPEQGARITQALDAAVTAIREEQRNAADDVAAETPIAAHRADALERIADGFLASEQVAVNGGERCTVHIHTDIDTLHADGNGAQSGLAAGGHVSAETSRRLACDCGVVHWLEDGSGQTNKSALDIGRRTRSIPPAIRRALDRRDRGCRFPGCTTRHYVDAHHIRHWADGGETRLDNLLLLCRHHHRLVHEGGYGLQLDASGGPVFTTPKGGVIAPGPETRFSGNVFALTKANRRNGDAIGPRALVPSWQGEKMDDGMAVEGLLRRE